PPQTACRWRRQSEEAAGTVRKIHPVGAAGTPLHRPPFLTVGRVREAGEKQTVDERSVHKYPHRGRARRIWGRNRAHHPLVAIRREDPRRRSSHCEETAVAIGHPGEGPIAKSLRSPPIPGIDAAVDSDVSDYDVNTIRPSKSARRRAETDLPNGRGV